MSVFTRFQWQSTARRRPGDYLPLAVLAIDGTSPPTKDVEPARIFFAQRPEEWGNSESSAYGLAGLPLLSLRVLADGLDFDMSTTSDLAGLGGCQ